MLVALVIAQFAARIALSRLVLPVGLAAGQPEDRLGVRLAHLLLPGDRRGGRRHRAGQPGLHAAVRHGAGREHRAGDHAGGAARPGRARHRLDPDRRLINSGAVGIELAIVVVLAVALIIAVLDHRATARPTTSSRRASPRTPRSYFAVGGGLMLAMIMGLATLVGFDSAANLAEEAKDPFRTVPRAIVGSVVAAAVLGLVFLIALTIAIRRHPRGQPPATRRSRRSCATSSGPVIERILLVAIAFAFFGAGLVTMTTCSRIVFAMSRDARFPAHQLMRRVNPRTRPRSRPPS